MRAYLSLRKTLAKIYLLQQDWITKISDADLRTDKINLNGNAFNAWTSILDDAIECKQSEVLIQLIKDDHKGNDDIKRLCDDYLAELLDSADDDDADDRRIDVPKPPALYAFPQYIGSHEFIGREDQLALLDEWAAASDPHTVLLFDAIGGMGKSMLTWEWTTKHAPDVRGDWAGYFWYSFYEGGADLVDFCLHALAYVTSRPIEDFQTAKPRELWEQLLSNLRERPWLFVLDGLERILVAYNRSDCASIPDEAANNPTDAVGSRHPCSTIRVEDGELLLQLTKAAPSKILMTSRLMPRSFVNSGSTSMPGVLRMPLIGLRPSDAEQLLRSCGIVGQSYAIRNFLKGHCDCHPLVTGVIAGRINDFMPDQGNFDAWSQSNEGNELSIGQLDLVQKRNHILKAAIDALGRGSKNIIHIMSLLSGFVSYDSLRELDKGIERLRNPDVDGEERMSTAFDTCLRDLQARGLLQYDRASKRYDLHPVVRAVALSRINVADKEQTCEVLVDYFSQHPQKPFHEANDLNDIQIQLQIIRVYLALGDMNRAADAYLGKICNVLEFRFRAFSIMLEILQPFFKNGWSTFPQDKLKTYDAQHLAKHAVTALANMGMRDLAEALALAALRNRLQKDDLWDLPENIVSYLNAAKSSRLMMRKYLVELNYQLAQINRNMQTIVLRSIDYILVLTTLGEYERAEIIIKETENSDNRFFVPEHLKGGLELRLAEMEFQRGLLTAERLESTEKIVKGSRNRSNLINFYSLRGEWLLSKDNAADAKDCLAEGIRLSHEAGDTAPTAQVLLNLANLRLGRNVEEIRFEATQLSRDDEADDIYLADLWWALGDKANASKHALEAYKAAWADGEPYVSRYELTRARALLAELGTPVPDLPRFTAASDTDAALIEEVRARIQSWELDRAAISTNTGPFDDDDK
jgi:tetratricopeptide (TPR) repeat protein